MRIAVIGAGAMGGLFGGLLAEAGHDVIMIEVSARQIEAISANGLRLETEGRVRDLRIPIGLAHSFAEARDLVIVFTKGMHTRDAVQQAAHLVGPETRVLTLQNGLGNSDAIAEVLPQAPILIGMTNWPADLHAPGHVISRGRGEVRLWSASRAFDPAIERVAEILDKAGLHCTADPQVEVSIWEKVAFNAALNSLCAATGVSVAAVGHSRSGRQLAYNIAAETLAVAKAAGLAVDLQRVEAAFEHAFREHGDHKPSMLQDIIAGRPTEIDTINGAVVRRTEFIGLDAPTTRILADLVRLREDLDRPQSGA